MSDGTNKLYFLDPQTFRVENILPVYDNKGPVRLLNELEYIKGKIYANVYTKDTIVVIDPHTGSILAYIDMAGILPSSDRTPETDVLNGIAYDKTKDRIFVTGKNWPKLFWVKFVKK
jgi:glutamine cyclotransferase